MDDDCTNAQYGETSCTQGVCVGQSVGGNCNNTASCNVGLYCNNGKCATQLKQGAACNTTDDSCGYPTVCGYGNVCTQVLSKSMGQSCATGAECATPNTCINVYKNTTFYAYFVGKMCCGTCYQVMCK